MDIKISNAVEMQFSISRAIFDLYMALNQELSQDWKTYTVTINDVTHELNPECEPVIRRMVVKELLKDALIAHIDSIDEDNDHTSAFNAFNVIKRILSGARKEDHQFEIIKEQVVTNLDADGNSITAKPLNEDNILVQWQDETKFKF
jgi:hypothetical protein